MQDQGETDGQDRSGNGAEKITHESEPGARKSGQAPAPAPMPQFYSAPEPFHASRFAGKGLRKPGDFRFAAKAHAVVLHAQEFRFAAAHYPIVFSDDAVAMPLAVLGYREGENLFVGADGLWAAGVYVPAYVRRYPFVIGQGAKPEEPILYLDRASEMLVDLADDPGGDPGADPLFVEGAPGERVKQAMEFCGAFQQQVAPTQAFVEAVAKHQLLETKEIRLDLADGKHQVLTGLRLIEEAKFNALSDEVFLEWRKKGWIAAVYWHWASMDNFRRLVQRG